MGNKSEATWHPGDGPVKPLDLDALVADILAQSARALNGTVPTDAAHFRQDIPNLLRIVCAALAAETARADQASTELDTLRKVYVEDATGWQEMHAEQMERADQADQRIAEALAAVRRSQRSEWVRELQSSIQRLSFADIIEAERILTAAPTAGQESK